MLPLLFKINPVFAKRHKLSDKRFDFTTNSKHDIKKVFDAGRKRFIKKLRLLGASFSLHNLNKLIHRGLTHTARFTLAYVYLGYFLVSLRRSFRNGAYVIFALFTAFYIDALLSDDEPLWEPIEWSLWQSWLVFIFFFSWIAENLITSRYGAFTGRDKRVWFAWYKAFKWFELWWMACTAIGAIFVITPFYFEVTYPVAQPVLYWQWYNRIFFVKFTGFFSCALLIAQTMLVGLRWLNWKKLFFAAFIVNCILAYLIYAHFMSVLFGYFTDINWYKKSIWTEYAVFGREPSKWSWGPKERDHFTYHRTPTIFWYKYDLPFASALYFTHMFFLISLVLLYWQWILILRRLYTTHELPFTFAVYLVSSLRQFFYFSLGFYGMTVFSVVFQFLRYPPELLWYRPAVSLLTSLVNVIRDLPDFFYYIFW